MADGHKGLTQPTRLAPADVKVTLECTLAEFFNGSCKTINYKRTQTNIDGRTLNLVNEAFAIQVKPGHSDSTVMTFKGKGNQGHDNYHHSNLVVSLKAAPEPNSAYSRSGNNLIYTHSLSLAESLNSSPIKIVTLDGRQINLNVDQYITPQTVHCIKGEGMPIPVGANDDYTRHLETPSSMPRGDLFVKFNIVFPKDLSSDKKSKILAILRQNQAILDQQDNEDE